VSYITLPSSGGNRGLDEVIHDGTLTGKGTSTDPLGVVPQPPSYAEWWQVQSFEPQMFTTPFLIYPQLDAWIETNSGSTDVDFAAGGVRFLQAGTYKVSIQLSFMVDKPQGMPTEFSLRAGLSDGMLPQPIPVMQGMSFANYEKGQWMDTVSCEFILVVKAPMTQYYLFCETIGDMADIMVNPEVATAINIQKVSA
jgi:hypothetical protein